MYLARVLSERVKLRMVWDEMEKEKMEIKFASNHAKDIATVLADETFTKENNQQEIEKLNNEFKVEIRTVKRKMNQIVAKKLENTISTTEVTEKVNTASVNEDNEKVFSANTKKEEIGIQVSEPIVPEPNTVSAKVEEKKEVTVNTDKLLEEAQNSFDQKDYDSALDKLKQVDNLLGN
ncbi:MAG: hypothetical protein MUF50_04235 [Planctomycetes bacterium]|nr:hypothetical protein [Planctomycetota bacterium]